MRPGQYHPRIHARTSPRLLPRYVVRRPHKLHHQQAQAILKYRRHYSPNSTHIPYETAPQKKSKTNASYKLPWRHTPPHPPTHPPTQAKKRRRRKKKTLAITKTSDRPQTATGQKRKSAEDIQIAWISSPLRRVRGKSGQRHRKKAKYLLELLCRKLSHDRPRSTVDLSSV